MVNLAFLVFGTFFVAAGGILYELFLGAFGSYIFGDSVKIFSLTAGVYMFSMGVGAFSIRHDAPRALKKLLGVEALLVLLHVLGPFLIWKFFIMGSGAGVAFWTVLSVSGLLVGTEIPLILGIAREIEGSSDARINQILAADYFGALVASVLFGFFLLPVIGLIGSASSAAIFECVGILFLFSSIKKRPLPALWVSIGFALLALMSILILVNADRLQRKLETSFYQHVQDGAEVIHSEWSGFSHISIVEYTAPSHRREVALLLDRQLQWSTGPDIARYHEGLTVPAIEAFKQANENEIPKRVLILGGGDALAAHTMRTLYDLPYIKIVDIDPRISELALQIPRWRESGGSAVEDSKVHLVHTDAFSFVRRMPVDEKYDLVVFDLPDPRSAGLARFFTPFFLRALAAHLSKHPVITIQASSAPQHSLGKLRYVCSLRNLLTGSGFESRVLTGDQMDFFIVAAPSPLKFPPPGKALSGVTFKNSSLIAEYLVDPLGYFESPQCKNEQVNRLLAPKLLEF